jgi:hypothetical protein
MKTWKGAMLLNRKYKHIVESLVLISISFLVFFGCDSKLGVWGYQDKIYVFADSALWLDIKDDLEEGLGQVLYTPQTEQYFYFEWQPLSKLNEHKKRMNLLFIGVQNESNKENDYLKKILPPEFKKGVKDGKYFYFFKDDLFHRGQTGLFLYAENRKSLKDNFNRLKNEIYAGLSNRYFIRLKEIMYKKGEQKEKEQYLSDYFGWKIRVQHDYYIANPNVKENYVWLRRFDPDRWFTVWKIKGDSSLLNQDSLIAIRNRLGDKVYSGDYVDSSETYLANVDFQGEKTVKLIGLWINDSLSIGGPFRSYAKYNIADSALYFIDYAVMAPTRRKKPFLDQLDVIARTFEITGKKMELYKK